MASASIWQPRFSQQTRHFRLFLSHTHAHRRDVGLLSSALSGHGIAAFVAHDSIAPSEEWEGVIVQALKDCEALGAYLTTDFPSSDWTDQEVGACVGRGVFVLPIKVGRDPYGFIGRYQAINGAGIDPHVLATEIAAILRSHVLTRGGMAKATVDQFVHSYSYDDARDNLKRLEAVPKDAWTKDLAVAVRQAVEENVQIKDAVVGFGDAAESLGARALRIIEPV